MIKSIGRSCPVRDCSNQCAPGSMSCSVHLSKIQPRTIPKETRGRVCGANGCTLKCAEGAVACPDHLHLVIKPGPKPRPPMPVEPVPECLGVITQEFSRLDQKKRGVVMSHLAISCNFFAESNGVQLFGRFPPIVVKRDGTIDAPAVRYADRMLQERILRQIVIVMKERVVAAWKEAIGK
jgi:hypothetical protein